MSDTLQENKIEPCNFISESVKYQEKEGNYYYLMKEVNQSYKYLKGNNQAFLQEVQAVVRRLKEGGEVPENEFLLKYDQKRRTIGAIKVAMSVCETDKKEEVKQKAYKLPIGTILKLNGKVEDQATVDNECLPSETLTYTDRMMNLEEYVTRYFDRTSRDRLINALQGMTIDALEEIKNEGKLNIEREYLSGLQLIRKRITFQDNEVKETNKYDN